MTPPEPAVLYGIVASLGTGLATAAGALPVLGLRRTSDGRQLVLLAFAGGVMLAASVFSLILPGIAAAQTQGFARGNAIGLVLGATLAGAIGMALLGRWLPVPEAVFGNADATGNGAPCPAERARSTDGAQKNRAVWLLVLAITLHNIPEGAAVGMAFSGGSAVNGLSTAIAIGTQNLPEGLAVACALVAAGLSRRRAFAGGALSGLAEPLAGTASAVLVAAATTLLPWGLALAAGAMLLIVFAQIIPDIVRNVRPPAFSARKLATSRLATSAPVSAFAGGLVLMCCLDIALA